MPDRSLERLVFLHGFTQTHHHWHACAHLIAQQLAVPPTVAFIDLPGHGLSADDRTPIDAAGPLGGAGGRGTLIGYSLGGRWALAAAVAGAPEIERLVLIGATAGIAEPDRRQARIASDRALADRIEAIGVESFVDEWLSAPMFASLPGDPVGRLQRMVNTVDGLASSLRLAGAGAQTPVWDRLGSVDIPVLVLAGEHDTKFAALAEQLAASLPHATQTLVPGAGHAAHTEQPYATANLIADWLRR